MILLLSLFFCLLIIEIKKKPKHYLYKYPNINIRIILLLFLVILFSLFIPPQIKANTNYQVNHDITYRFTNDNTCEINHTIIILNKNTNIYPSEYDIQIYGRIIGDIKSYESEDLLDLTTTYESDNYTKVSVVFKQKSVGLGKKLSFDLNYQQDEYIMQLGNVKEIILPKITNINNNDIYNISIIAPLSYGKVAYTKPSNTYIQKDNTYIFNYDNNFENGIIIGLGSEAIYDFEFNYYLKNNQLFTKNYSIFLPPNTSYQEVIFNSIEPKPENIQIDADGNWEAIFRLPPQKEINIIAKGSILLITYPKNLNMDQPKQYVTKQKYWEVDDYDVQKIAKKLSTAEDIYDYVKKNLTYNFQKINSANLRLGAKKALGDPSNSICMEFTDTFVTLARANNIPSREIIGYVITNNKTMHPVNDIPDLLHTWPEFWDEKNSIWVSIDPTWGNTTGGLDYYNSWDFNHIALVIHATSSTYPPSINTFKKNITDKSIKINPAISFTKPTLIPLTAKFIIPSFVMPFSSIPIKLEITNPNGFALRNVPIQFKVDNYKLTLTEVNIDLPPFGKKDIHTKIYSSSVKNIKNINILAVVDNEILKYIFRTDSSNLTIIAFLTLFLFISLLLIFIAKGDPKRKK